MTNLPETNHITILKAKMLEITKDMDKFTTFYQLKDSPAYYFTSVVPMTIEEVETLRDQIQKEALLYRHNLSEDDIEDTLNEQNDLNFDDFVIGHVKDVHPLKEDKYSVTFAIVTFEIRHRDVYYFKSTGSQDDYTFTEDKLALQLIKGKTGLAFRVQRALGEYHSHPDVRVVDFDRLKLFVVDGQKEYYSYCVPKGIEIDYDTSLLAPVQYKDEYVGRLDFTSKKLVHGEGVCNVLVLLCDLPYVDYNTPIPVFVKLVFKEDNVIERIVLEPFVI